MSLSAGNECIYLWPRKVLLISRTNIFLWRCASMASPHWLTLRGPLLCNTANCYLFAAEPHNGFQYCLKNCYKYVYFTNLQVYKWKHVSVTNFSIFQTCLVWFLFSIDCNICGSCLLIVLNFFILAFLWILLLNICPTAFVGRSSWQSIRQYLPWAANNS